MREMVVQERKKRRKQQGRQEIYGEIVGDLLDLDANRIVRTFSPSTLT